MQGQQRVFPHTEKASDVVRVLHEYMKKNNVTIETVVTVKKILSEKNTITGIQTSARTYTAKNILLQQVVYLIQKLVLLEMDLLGCEHLVTQ